LRPTTTVALAEAQGTAARRQIEGDGGNNADPRLRTSLQSILPSAEKTPTAEVRVSELLIAVSTLVLLVACANVASLLIARGLRRRREIAVRLALGIGRGRLMAQLVVEAVVLALLGGVGALLVVRWGGGLVRDLLLSNYAWDAAVDGRVLGYTAVIALGTGLLAGIIPAIGAGATDLARALKEGAREGSPQRSRMRNLLLLAQLALAVVLLVGTGLFVRSLQNVNAVELGMQTNRVIVATMDLGPAGFAPSETQSIFSAMAQRARAVHGIAGVAIGGALPFSSSYAVHLRVPGIDSLPRVSDGGPYVNAVTPEFFSTLGIRILRGRGFTAADQTSHARIMIVSESMTRLIWRGRDPIGQCISYNADSLPCTTIVGVAENTHRNGIVEGSEVLQYYVQLEYAPVFMRDRILFIRPLAGDPAPWIEPIRRVLQTTLPRLPYADVRPMNTLLSREVRPWRLGATMFGVFGLLALLLTVLGLYSVVAYAVAQRTHELGVRIALGASGLRIVGLIVRRGVTLAILGVTLGIAIALAAGRFVEPLLFHVSARDPLTLALVATLLILVAVGASLLPARRAATVDPVEALRSE
jgi:predicted permease